MVVKATLDQLLALLPTPATSRINTTVNATEWGSKILRENFISFVISRFHSLGYIAVNCSLFFKNLNAGTDMKRFKSS